MSLELALVIKGDQAGAKKALDDTGRGIEELGKKSETAKGPVNDVATALEATVAQAEPAATGISNVGAAAEASSTKLTNFKTFAIGAIGGIAGALASAALETAFNLAVGAAIDYFDTVTNSAANIAADIDAHKGLIREVKGLWDEASGAASSYGLKSAPGLTVDAQENIGRLNDDFGSSVGRLDTGLIGRGITRNRVGGSFEAGPLNGVLEGLQRDLEDGKADIIRWRNEVDQVVMGLPIDSPFRKWREDFMANTEEAATTQAELQRAVDVFKALTGDAEAAAAAMGKSAEKMTGSGAAATGALGPLQQYQALLAQIGGFDAIGTGAGSFGAFGAAGFQGTPGTIGGSFAAGGFTGHMPADRVAGVVHGKEFVFDADATSRIGPENLEAIRRGVKGYAGGGYVGRSSGGYGGGSGIVDIAGSLAQSFYSLRGSVGDLIGEVVKSKDPIAALGGIAATAGDRLLSFAAGALDSLSNKAMGNAGNGIFDLLIGAVTGSLGGGGGLGTGAIGRGNFGGTGGFFPAFPGFATGTSNAPGGWSIVGEQGPELRYLDRGSQIFSNGDSRRMLGGGDPLFQVIDQRRSGAPISAERGRGPNGEAMIRAIVRDELPTAYRDSYRRGALG